MSLFPPVLSWLLRRHAYLMPSCQEQVPDPPEDNTAHLVAQSHEDARHQWGEVFSRDRADLGPGHARQLAIDAIDRYGAAVPPPAPRFPVTDYRPPTSQPSEEFPRPTSDARSPPRSSSPPTSHVTSTASLPTIWSSPASATANPCE